MTPRSTGQADPRRRAAQLGIQVRTRYPNRQSRARTVNGLDAARGQRDITRTGHPWTIPDYGFSTRTGRTVVRHHGGRVGHRSTPRAARRPGKATAPAQVRGEVQAGPSPLINAVLEPCGRAPSSVPPWSERDPDCDALITDPLITRYGMAGPATSCRGVAGPAIALDLRWCLHRGGLGAVKHPDTPECKFSSHTSPRPPNMVKLIAKWTREFFHSGV